MCCTGYPPMYALPALIDEITTPDDVFDVAPINKLNGLTIKSPEISETAEAIAEDTSDKIGTLLISSITPALILTNSMNLFVVKLVTVWSLT